ncbi:uncharacterized protein LOC143019869 [Oratosquilla oratoria]|uniref:uncharacterized protein LOC143019869 n=1 Tax=Oratosquilla oratoria TaxID=337810 RepID=UPI003F7755AC
MFNLENFVKTPSAEEVRKLNKPELEMIAHHYQISECSGLNKNPLKDKILEYLEENKLILASREDVGGASPVNDLALQVELKKLELEIERLKSQSHGIEKTPNIPKFNEDEPDKFFSIFEKLARMYQWPFSQWTQKVYGALSGKALDTFIALSESQSSDYYVLKYNILQAYQLVPEAYRQQFRKCRKSNQETYVEYFQRKLRLFTRWVESEEAHVDLEKLKGLILMEDIRKNIPPDVSPYLALKLPPTRDSKPIGPPQPPRPPAHSSSASSTSGKPIDSETRESTLTGGRSYCKYCKRPGHHVDECFKLQQRKAPLQGSPSLSINVAEQSESFLEPCLTAVSPSVVPDNPSPPMLSTFEPFCSSGSVALDQDSPPTSIKLLRDTGSALSLITKNVAALIDACYTGNWVLVNFLTGGSHIPICQVYLRSDVRTGYAQVGVVDKLPVEGVSLLIGNDLAGGTMLPNVIGSSCPCAENNTSQLEADIPGIFTACAVTRSMSRRVEAEISEHKEDAHVGVITPQPSENTEDVPTQPDLADLSLVTRSRLIRLQKEDPELTSCFRRAISEEEAKSESNCYYLSSDILMQKFRPTDSPANYPWSVRHQIMVPSPLRKEILGIAHNGVGGHLGVRKTSAKILTHFYWHKVKRDISSYISTCHRCQVAGKPHPSVKPFPLQPIPVIEEPFGRIVIDCVGPLPKTPRGNQFLFTMIDCATRYPEAIPLRRITAKNVVRALIHFFTQVGLLTVVQSDQGSNFTSRLFNQVMQSLGVRQSRSSAYHPQSQGVVERFHQPFKRMLRTYCLEFGKDWDEGVDLLLFTVRDSVQESLGFSPFQLIYGHEVRGPLKALKESWLLENSVIPLVSYVVEFREKLKAAVRLANAHLKSAQMKMKQQFDKKHKVEHREFRVGDKVLAFLPVQTHPFQSRYDGPFQIVDRVGDANYVVYTPGRRKKKRLVHVNLLKPYRVRKSKEREENFEPSLPACVVVPTCDHDQKDNFPELQSGLYAKVDNSTILYDPSTKLGHLSNDQASDISSLLTDYSDIFSDHPHPCSAVEHDIETNGARPIRQRPYHLNAFKKEYVREEVQRLQEVGIVEPSSSPWASPVVLVPKPDGSMRLCIDYRKLNAVTELDSYPLPRIDDVIDEVGRAQWVTKLDLLQGYYQVRLSERSRAISAFITPEGLYQFTVLPFGLRNAPATFQRLMNIVTAGLVGVRCYLDDLVVFSDSWGEHVDRLRALFAILAAHSLTVNLAKSEFGHARITFLEHVVGKGEVQPIAAKITAILQYPAPSDKKGVMRLLGMADYYRRFCPNFSSVVAPLTDLLSTKTSFKWTQACQDSFESVKALLANAPVLRAPDLQRPFTIHVDASEVGAGAVLLQEGEEDHVLHPVCYFSKKFLKAQRNYATIEKEALALIMALEAAENENNVSQIVGAFKHNSSLDFTHELKPNYKLPFLDILVHRNTHSFSTEVYVKDVSLDFRLNGASVCPEKYRRSVVNSFVKRALTHYSTWTIKRHLASFMTQAPSPIETPCNTSLYYKNFMSFA